MQRLPHFRSLTISVPRRFHITASDILPNDAAERAEWKEASNTRWL